MTESLGNEDKNLLLNAVSIIGVDEVGRGCLAGPVVVAAVSFSSIKSNPVIQDSKKLKPSQREQCVEWIKEKCCDWVILEIWNELIDRVNILEATKLAMSSAIKTIVEEDSVVVVDGRKLNFDEIRAKSVIFQPKADSSFMAVAAASILAKVHRDKLMRELAVRHQSWQWQSNKGYGTVVHRRALDQFGRSFLHRRSFTWTPVLP